MLATWRIAPGAGRRQHRRAQAAGVGAADRVAAGRHRRRGRAARRRVQRRAGHRARGRGAADPPPGHQPAVSSPGRCRPPASSPRPPPRNIVPLSFELGGKSPLLVFDDADLDLAVNLAVEQFDNAGQVCLGAFRVLVHESHRRRVPAARAGQGRHRRAGRPARRGHRRRRPGQPRRTSSGSTGSSQRALADGARAVLGGGPNTDLGGLYFRPTILVDAGPAARSSPRRCSARC